MRSMTCSPTRTFLPTIDEQERELKTLRGNIKDGESPDWMIDALEAMHDTYPEAAVAALPVQHEQ